MSGFTHLESAVLNAMCGYNDEYGIALCAMLPDMSVKSRENTGHGFYTNLNVNRTHPPIFSQTGMSLSNAHMSDMGDGNMMGFVLWLEDGYPNCLEGFQYGDTAGNTVDLRERDLASLTFTQLEPLLKPI